MAHHIVPPKTYYTVFAMLMVLLAMTVAAAEIENEVANTIIAISIAITKAVLIILFFMHVKYSTNLTRIVACAGFVWLLILLVLLAADFETRDWQLNNSPSAASSTSL